MLEYNHTCKKFQFQFHIGNRRYLVFLVLGRASLINKSVYDVFRPFFLAFSEPPNHIVELKHIKPIYSSLDIANNQVMARILPFDIIRAVVKACVVRQHFLIALTEYLVLGYFEFLYQKIVESPNLAVLHAGIAVKMQNFHQFYALETV